VTFALCGFANFSSIAIQMAVTGGLAPNQRPMIAKLGIKALIAGSLANLLSAALAGIMIPA
jgi:CNT family concentrative nucleoside transporter